MGKPLPLLRPTSYEAIVALYIAEKRPLALDERDSFAREATFQAAVRRAALALNEDGTTVHDHQKTWVWPEVREAWAEKLVANLALLEAAGSFEDLHDHRLTSLRIRGIGKLTLDAFVLCLENGAVDAAEVHSRGALEASLSIDWVLKQGKEEWGRRIWIYSLRQNLQWVRKLIPGRPEYDRYMAGRAEMGVPARNPTEEELTKHLAAEAEILEKLNEDDLREMNAEFEAYAQKRGHEADWFRAGKDGVSSIYKIAEKLGRLNEYDTFYRSLSYSVHGSHAIKSLIFEPGRIGVEPVRAFEGFATTFGIGINTAMNVYARIIGEYRPDEKKGFSRKYLDEWRDRLRNLPEIEIEPERVRL